MEIRICQNKMEWDNFFFKQENNEFLQSWDWGEFQRSAGHEPLRLQVVENEDVVWQGQGFVHRLPLGLRYLYLPRVVISDLGFQNSECELWQCLINFCKLRKLIFIRIEPLKNVILHSEIKNLNSQNRQPRQTLILNLTQSTEELLSKMHAKTRYNISLAEKKGVTVKQEKNADIFWRLNEETKSRDKFKSHNKNYYSKMLESENAIQLTAYFGDKPIASNICVYFGDTFTYLHGASSNEMRNLMAPYLLQWRGIELAKNLGCKYYDFWGISPVTNNKKQIANINKIESCFHNLCWEATHPWTGVTRFKAGFGGEVREYPNAFDVVLNKIKFKFYQIFRKLNNKLKIKD